MSRPRSEAADPEKYRTEDSGRGTGHLTIPNGHGRSRHAHTADNNADDPEASSPHTSSGPHGPPSQIGTMLQAFSPLWFSFSMNAGILAIIMHRFPYPFHGLPVLTDIMFCVDLFSFLLFTALYITKAILYPTHTFRQLSTDASQLPATACFPMALLTNAALIGLILSTPTWGGQWALILSHVLWWLGTTLMLLDVCIVYFSIITTQIIHTSSLPLTIFIPVIGIETAATTGGLITGAPVSTDAAFTRPSIAIIITSLILTGLGLFNSLPLYSTWLHRHLQQTTPRLPPTQLPALTLLVGPMAQSSLALQLLGSSAVTHFPLYSQGSFFQSTPAHTLDTAAELLALLTFGYALFWLLLTVWALLDALARGRFKGQGYALTWYSTIFPAGTLVSSMLIFGEIMNSGTWRVLAVVLFVVLLLDFFLNLGYTLVGIGWGDLLGLKGRREKIEAGDRDR